YYNIGLVGALFVILVLVFSKKIIRVNTIKKLEIKYKHKFETKEFIQKYFENKGIIVSDVNFKVTQDADKIIYVNVYEIEIPRDLNYASIIEDISMNKNIMCIQMISI
ncbi:MAG: MgtC/SapB family protein, partial [Lactobacillus iners]|nr:MgtC/SapB family protein [Lactobacillus iners]MCT7782695.1 MgtC/SapB family protein [Lactobacillus iners]